jgi:hypothetical protein
MYLEHVRRIGRLGTFLLFALVAMWNTAQAKPNFTGEWKLNLSKSEFGPIPAPNSRTDKITHEEPNVKVSTSSSTPNGDFTAELKYTTDGKESTNEIRGNTIKSSAKWEGDALVINSKGSFGGNDLTITDKWTLSEDGKTLTIGRHFVSSQGELDQKVVMEKQ